MKDVFKKILLLVLLLISLLLFFYVLMFVFNMYFICVSQPSTNYLIVRFVFVDVNVVMMK